MNGPETVNGVVLFAAPSGDYDKRLILLTKERGKITAFAKGARKSTSSLLAAANPFVFGTFQVYEGKTAYNLYQADIHYHFRELTANIPGVYYGYYFLEFASYYGREGLDASDMVNLLYVTLKALAKKRISEELIRRVFELKLLVVNGEYPQMFSCVECRKTEGLIGFSFRRGGAVCEQCREKVPDMVPISASLSYTMQYVITAGLEKLYAFNVTDEVLAAFSALLDRYLSIYVDGDFKSLSILQMMT